MAHRATGVVCEVRQMIDKSLLRKHARAAIRNGKRPSRRSDRSLDESRQLVAAARELVRTADETMARSKARMERSRGGGLERHPGRRRSGPLWRPASTRTPVARVLTLLRQVTSALCVKCLAEITAVPLSTMRVTTTGLLEAGRLIIAPEQPCPLCQTDGALRAMRRAVTKRPRLSRLPASFNRP
jgi:hypothetical protein